MKSKPSSLPLARLAAVFFAVCTVWLAAVPNAHGQTFLYWDLNGFTAGSGGTGGTAPSGTWSDSGVNWNTASDGIGAPFFWIDNSVAVFSAGTNATGTYTVSLDPGSSIIAGGVLFQEGDVTFGGTGTLSFVQPVPGITPYFNLSSHPVAIGSGVTLSSAFGLALGGSGTLTLSGQTNVLGTTTLDSLTLVLGGADRLSDLSTIQINSSTTLDLANFNETVGGLSGAGKVLLGSGTLTIASVTDTTFSGAITGTGGVIKSGTGALTLSTAAAWTGGTTISNGTLALGASDLFPDDAALSVVGSGAFVVGSYHERVGSLTGTGAVSLAGGSLELGTASSFSFNGGINGLGSVIKRGPGTLTLGGVNTFLGTASVQGGTLRLGANERLPNLLDLDVGAGTTFDLAGFTESIDALTGTGTVTLNGGELAVGHGNGFFTVGAAFTGPGTFSKYGSGIATLTGTFGPSGLFSVQQGVALLGASDRIADTADVFIAPGAGFSLGSFNETVATLGGFGSVSLGSGRLTVAGPADSTFSGVISGTGGLTKSGAGVLSLLGESTYTGITFVNAGTLRLYGDNRLPYGVDANIAAGASLELGWVSNSGSQTFGQITGAGDVSGVAGSFGLTCALGADNSSFTFPGRLRGIPAYRKLGVGTLTLSGANDFTNTLEILFGSVRLAADQRLPQNDTADIQLAPGTVLDLAGHVQKLNGLSGVGTLELGTGGGAANLHASESHDFAGTIHGFGTVTKTGADRYRLAGPLTFSGPTNVQAGWLRLAKSGTIDTTVTVSSGAKFELEDVDVTLNQILGPGAVDLGAGQLAVGGGGGDFTFNGALGGQGGSTWVKSGSGVLTLTGTAAPGTILINGNKLALGANERINDSTAVKVVNGATFDVAGFTESIGPLLGGGTVTLGSGALSVGSGTGNFGFDGDVTGAGSFTKTGNTSFALHGRLLQTGGLSVTGGTLTLDGDERILDSTTLNLATPGVFDLGGCDETLAAVTGSGAIKLPSPSALTVGFNDTTSTFGSTINGDGALRKIGAGDVTFTGNSTNELRLAIDQGRFFLGGNDLFDAQTHVDVNGTGVFYVGGYHQQVKFLSGNGTARVVGFGRLLVNGGNFLGTLENLGTVEKVGPGTFTLEQLQNFIGYVVLTDGQLQLAAEGTWTFGRTTTAAHGTLSLVGNSTLNGDFIHAGTLNGQRTTLTGAVSGAGTFSGDIVMQGSYAPGPVAGLATAGQFSSALTFAPTHTLELDLKGTTRGTQYDALDVYGQLTLGGTLRLVLGGGFVPAAGQTFQLFSAGSRAGNFTAFDLPALPHGLAWDTSRISSQGELTVVAGYAAFIAAAGLDLATNGAPLANPSGDGVSNLLKYLLGGDPRVAQGGLLPVATTDLGAGGTVLVLSYDRDALAAATLSAVGVEYSTDCATWTTAVPFSGGITFSVTPIDAIFEHVEVRIPIGGPRGFARVKATL